MREGKGLCHFLLADITSSLMTGGASGFAEFSSFSHFSSLRFKGEVEVGSLKEKPHGDNIEWL